MSGASPGQGTVTVTIQSLTDSSESTTATATLNVASPVQMQVAIIANSGLTPVEGTTTTITSSVLAATVANSNIPATGIVYTVTTAPADGSLLLNGQALAAGDTFTQDDINNGRLAYQSIGQGTDSFSFSVAATNAVGTSGTFQIVASDLALVPTGGFTYTATEGMAATAQTVATFTDPGGAEAAGRLLGHDRLGRRHERRRLDLGRPQHARLHRDWRAHLCAIRHLHGRSGFNARNRACRHGHQLGRHRRHHRTVLTLVHDLTAAATEGSSTTITSAMLETSDSDSSVTAANIVYTVTALPADGKLLLNGQPLAINGTFTQDDIDNGRVTYQATEEGADSFGFSVAAGAASPITATFAVTISDPAVVVTGGFTYTATEGSTGAVQTVATFTDPGGAEALADYSATIDWGDGSSATAGLITVDPTTHVFTVSGQHSYAQDGTFSIGVTVAHDSAPTATATSTADIAGTRPPVQAASWPPPFPSRGMRIARLRTCRSPPSPTARVVAGRAISRASINWGDGTTSVGTVSLFVGHLHFVAGSHEYFDEGHYTVQVSIDQTAGTPTSGTTSATVSATATIHEQLLPNGTVGTPDENWIQQVYRDLFNRQPEMQGFDYWTAELDAGESRFDVAYQIIQVLEFEEFQHDTVTALYQQYLGRAPDPGGLAYWSAYLYQGGTIEGLSEALVSSPEYYQVHGGGTVEGFLTALFQDALGRAVRSGRTDLFRGADGQWSLSRRRGSRCFLQRRIPSRPRKRTIRRVPESSGRPRRLSYFAGEFDDGLTDQYVISQLLASDEYYDDVPESELKEDVRAQCRSSWLSSVREPRGQPQRD